MDRRRDLRSRALGFAWAIVFAVVVAVVFDQATPSADDLPAAVALTTLIGALAFWPNLRGSRVEYDPSTPIVVASALAVSAGTAPVLLLAQAVLLTVIDSISHRRSISHTFINAGVFSLWHGGLGLMVMHSNLGRQDLPFMDFAIGLLIVTTLAVMLNNLTVASSTAYLYRGHLERLDLGLRDQARDIAVSVSIGLTIHRIPGPDWVEAVFIVAVVLYGLWYVERYREHRAALLLEIQARIVDGEAHGPNPGHSERVGRAVRELHSSYDVPIALAETAAWTHSLHVDPRGHMCSGIDTTEYLTAAVRSIPRMERVRRLQPEAGLPFDGSSALTHVLAAACAWDSRCLPGSPVRSPDDLIYTFGIDRTIADRVVDIDPGWVTAPVRTPADASRRR